ncbi:hypothetical protein MRX96_036907 [Rhipicephalus microplus]
MVLLDRSPMSSSTLSCSEPIRRSSASASGQVVKQFGGQGGITSYRHVMWDLCTFVNISSGTCSSADLMPSSSSAYPVSSGAS